MNQGQAEHNCTIRLQEGKTQTRGEKKKVAVKLPSSCVSTTLSLTCPNPHPWGAGFEAWCAHGKEGAQPPFPYASHRCVSRYELAGQ